MEGRVGERQKIRAEGSEHHSKIQLSLSFPKETVSRNFRCVPLWTRRLFLLQSRERKSRSLQVSLSPGVRVSVLQLFLLPSACVPPAWTETAAEKTLVLSTYIHTHIQVFFSIVWDTEAVF